jgi:hypothetical protein
MNAGKVIAYICAAILIFFGVLFIWGSFCAPGGGGGWIVVGLVSVGIGFGLIWFAGRRTETPGSMTVKLDLPANVQMDALKCKSCGGTLTSDAIKLVAGAPVVTCPYCNSTYQLTEEPKW